MKVCAFDLIQRCSSFDAIFFSIVKFFVLSVPLYVLLGAYDVMYKGKNHQTSQIMAINKKYREPDDESNSSTIRLVPDIIVKFNP